MPHCCMVKKTQTMGLFITIHFDEVRIGNLTTFQDNYVAMRS